MKNIRRSLLCVAIAGVLAGCNSSTSKPEVSQSEELPPLAECRTMVSAPAMIVKGNDQSLTRQIITIGATSDMHGRIRAYDYALDRENGNAGFSKIATLLKEERVNNPDMLMIDLGDTVQGNSAELFNNMPVHPVVDTMNFLDYDLWVPGNHEFDFERSFLDRNLDGFNGAVVSSNIIWDKNSDACSAPDGEEGNDDVPFLPGFQMFDVNGAKVAIVGVTPSMVPSWQASNPDNFRNLDFTNELDAISVAVNQAIAEHTPDVVIGAFHLGRSAESSGVGVQEVASKLADKFDVIFMGHEHAQFIEQTELNAAIDKPMQDISGGTAQVEDKDAAGVYNESNRQTKVKVIEPGKWGWALAKADIELTKDDKGRWNIVDTTLSNRTVSDVEEDKRVQTLSADIHDKSVKDANLVVGTVEGNFLNSATGGADEATDRDFYVTGAQGARLYSTVHQAKVMDTPLVDLINQVQIAKVEEAFANDPEIKYEKVDVSAAALFADTSNLYDGQEFRKKDSSNLYLYDNMLVAVKIQGKQLKDYMEWSYSYLNGWKEGDLTVSFNPDIRSYNYDLFDGNIRYEVDLSQTAREEGHDGNRITIHEIRGGEFDENATYVVAINDYRYGATMMGRNGWITPEDKLWDSSNETVYAIRDMVTELVAKQGGLNRDDYNNPNWFISQYGDIDEKGQTIAGKEGDILKLRNDGGKGEALWNRLVNQEICVVLEGERTPSIGNALNVNDDSTWFENPAYAKDATPEELEQGCSD